jgi:hypothetical protein
MSTVAGAENPPAFCARYVNDVEPLKLSAGVYVNPPFAFSETEPAAAGTFDTMLAVSGPVPASLPNTPGAATVSGWSSFVE